MYVSVLYYDILYYPVRKNCKHIFLPLTLNSKPTSSFCSGTTSVVPACQCALKSTVGSLLAGVAREKGRRRIGVMPVALHWACNPVQTVPLFYY